MKTTDLTQRPPRGPRVRLGGLVLLPRVLDKCRATIAGKNGEYNFNCPLDQRFFAFAKLNAEDFKQQVQAGKGDREMLEWMLQNAPHLTAPTISAWSAQEEQRAPSDTETRAFFNELHQKAAPEREDIATWFDLLDLDDYVSYGGQP